MNYDNLIGVTPIGTEEKLTTTKEVAEFICKNGTTDDVIVYDKNGDFFLDTFGIYINKIANMDYRTKLLEVLIPMQKKVETGVY